MTRGRYEIEFQGSNDGENWIAYPFRNKPQALNQAPRIYAPYQPRFDWNLWFASLGDWRQNDIVPLTEERLLENDPDVLALFRSNPFPQAPPRYVRAVLWQYWFTTDGRKAPAPATGGGANSSASTRPNSRSARTANLRPWKCPTNCRRMIRRCSSGRSEAETERANVDSARWKSMQRACVIGSGPNGLAAAIVLAQAGLHVDVFEAEAEPGGATRTLPLTLPGFLHDFGSAVHPLAAGSPFFTTLPLADYGLEWIHGDAPLAHPLDDGTAVIARARSGRHAESALGADGKAGAA